MATPNLTGITSVLPALLASTQLGATGATAVYTVGASKAAQIKTMNLCNVAASPVTVTVGIIPAGGTADGTHEVVHAIPLAAGDSTRISEVEGAWLPAGTAVTVSASTAGAVDVVISGLEFA